VWFATFFTTFAANKFSETALTFRFSTMTRKKKTIIIASSLLAILCLWALCVCVLIHGARTKVTHTKFKLGDPEQFLMTDIGYTFDTGANVSLLVDIKNAGTLYWLCPAIIIDSNLHPALGSLYYGDVCQIEENLHIFGFVFGTEKETVHGKTFSFIEGTIGMNVICKANWLFSLKTQRAESLPLDSTVAIPADAVTLSYRGHLTPMTDLDINGHHIKNVLIDTGLDIDLTLDQTTSTIELGVQIRQDTIESIGLNSKRIEVKKAFKSVNINSKSYQNVSVNFSNINLLGLGFMRRFDYIFWDSKHKKVYLWNDKSSENK